MRALLATSIAAAIICLAGSAHAERKMFIVSSNADGYGVDRCLETGARCGAAVATAYCKARQFVTAASYRKVEKDDITGSIPTEQNNCQGGNCDEFVAIVCSR
jgi:hypothetical protein